VPGACAAQDDPANGRYSGHGCVPSPLETQLTPETAAKASTAEALAAVRRLSFAALDATAPDAVYNEMVKELFGVFGVEQIHLNKLSHDRTLGRATEYRLGPKGEPKAGAEYVHELGSESASMRVAEAGEPFNESDAPHSERMNPSLVKRFKAASSLFVPVAWDGEVRCVVGVISEVPRVFTEEEVQMAFTLVNQCGSALAALEMRAHLHARAEQQTALARAARALNARLDLRSVLQTLCREADLALDAGLAGVYLGDAEDGGLAVAGHGLPEDSDWYGYVIAPGEGVAGQVLMTGEPVITNSYRTDTHVPSHLALQPVETAVAVPMRWDGELKGALSVGFYSMRRVTEEDMRTLEAMADLAGMACSNAEAFERAQVASRTDSLTGLLNHGAVHIRILEEIARARRTEEPLCCLLMDLDNFKPINDTHGHLVGDQILRDVAAAVTEELRAYDAIGRFGGDEFAMVLHGATEDEADLVAHRLQDVITATAAAAGLGAGLTASVGIASWREPLTAAELLDRADRALLVGKRRGGSRTVIATSDTKADLARLEAEEGGPTQLLADLWDMVSRCDRPSDVLNALPGFLVTALGADDCVVVHQHEYPFRREVLDRLAGGAIARPSLSALREALGAWDLPVRPANGAHAAVALMRDGHAHGLLVMRTEAPAFALHTIRLAELLCDQAVTALLGQMGGASRSAVGALAAAIDARDNYTHSHSEQVVTLACAVATRLKLSDGEIEQVRDGAMLHDVGKVAIPNEILYKPGPLTPEEWEVMREHPTIGEQILLRTPELEHIAPLVRHEHERWDGNGYPDGLAGEDIPIGSRIIFACDAYNAMITARPYREPMSLEDAVDELWAGAGSQFDPRVVQTLLAVLHKSPIAASI
jgi:diguanylate cyclase (GGDEF)-like protein